MSFFAGWSAFLSLTETITITPIVKTALRGHLDARLIIFAWIYTFEKYHPRMEAHKKNPKPSPPLGVVRAFLCARGVESRLFQEKAGQVEGTEVSVAPPASASASPPKALLASS